MELLVREYGMAMLCLAISLMLIKIINMITIQI